MTPGFEKNSDGLFDGLKRLYGYFPRRRKWQLFVVLGLMLVGAVAELVTLGAVLPFLALLADPGKAASFPFLQQLFSTLGWSNPDQILVPATLLFATMAIGAGAVRLVLAWVSQKYVFRLGHDLGVEVYQRTLYQPYSYHVSKNTSEMIAAIGKVDGVVGGMLLPLMYMGTASVISIFILTALLLIDPFVALSAALGFAMIYVAVSFATRNRLRANSKIIASTQTERIKAVQEGLGGIRDVLIDQAQPIYVDKFSRASSAFRNAQAVNVFIGVSPRFVIEASGMVLIAVLALFLSRGTGGLVAALPVLGALALGAQRLLPLLQLIYSGWTQIAGNRHILYDVLAILDLPDGRQQKAETKETKLIFENEITLNKVGFRYGPDSPQVLNKISLKIEKGARVGFVGKTGCGKSTIMDLVMGLLEPTTGEIRIDGEVLARKNVLGWQAQIAHVPQAIYLTDASIEENIAFGILTEEINIDRLQDAADRAELGEFIGNLADGYKTIVGERGVRLSGGQRQRIGIARALYKQASVLVFDEATSALDTETESAVMGAIQSLDRDLTILIIAHRVSTVAGCDKVVKLDAGDIIAEGLPKIIINIEKDEIAHPTSISRPKKHA